jgi:hypothetical protein
VITRIICSANCGIISTRRRKRFSLVVGIGRAVAEAAREGDFIGIGGRLVSDGERAVIAAVAEALTS